MCMQSQPIIYGINLLGDKINNIKIVGRSPLNGFDWFAIYEKDNENLVFYDGNTHRPLRLYNGWTFSSISFYPNESDVIHPVKANLTYTDRFNKHFYSENFLQKLTPRELIIKFTELFLDLENNFDNLLEFQLIRWTDWIYKESRNTTADKFLKLIDEYLANPQYQQNVSDAHRKEILEKYSKVCRDYIDRLSHDICKKHTLIDAEKDKKKELKMRYDQLLSQNIPSAE